RLLEQSENELADWMQSIQEQRYRADQVQRWVFDRRAERFDPMTDIPSSLRAFLTYEWIVFASETVSDEVAPDGTEKLLIQWSDGKRVECVLLHEDDRHTVCLSTQVGCGMGCGFCASGLRGLERNLTSGEIIEQVLRLRNRLPLRAHLSNIVAMGMG